MRIAIDLIAAEYEPGGMLLVTRALLYGLSRLKEEHEYFVLTGRPEEYQELAQSANVHICEAKLPLRRGVLVQHQVFAPSILRRIQPHILHTPAFAAPLRWRGALVITINDLAFMKVPEQSSLYPRLYHKYVQRQGARRAQRVIAISQQTHEELQHYWSIPEERIRLVHHALRPSLQPGNIPAEKIAAMQQRYGQRYLLHVGRIMPRKNVEILLEAFQLVAERFPDLHLVLTGGLGYASEKAVQLINTSPYKDRIHLAGWVAEEDMAPLYAGATALVFPSKHEGQGMPTLEAMACGTAVIASHEAASYEIAGNALLRSDCSLPQPLADTISQLLADDTLRAHLIQDGKKQALPYAPEVCARETLNVYEETWDVYRKQR